LQNLLLILSAGLMLGAVVPYLVDVVRKKTKPRIVTWFIWTVLMAIAGIASLNAGATASAVLSFASALSTGLVVIFGYKNSDKAFGKLDVFSFSGALMGLGLWWAFNSPLIAIAMSVLVDLVGAVPTLWHAYKKPQEETPSAFVMYFFSALLALLAIQDFSITAALVPLYLMTIDGSIAAIILIRKRIRT
jgi:hypothetical protein